MSKLVKLSCKEINISELDTSVEISTENALENKSLGFARVGEIVGF